MKDRKTVVEYIERFQNEGENKKRIDKLKPSNVKYGLIELRDLLDFIYSGKPTCDEEKLNKIAV